MIAALVTMLTGSTLLSNSTAELADYCYRRAQTARVRGIGKFALNELIIPEGKYRGEHFRYRIQPFTRLIHQEIDSGRWNRTALTGCVQAGKSLQGYILPACWHLFEHCEPVILGASTIDSGKTKYRREMLPVIRANRCWRELLPERGAGSRGGVPDEIEFANGAVLKFMGAGGDDATRSSYTSRVVVMTEVDKYDTAGEVSREAPPVRQMENRAASYEEYERRIYLECTVSIEEGAIWQEYLQGTRSQIVVQCRSCKVWCTPEREQLFGYQHAENKEQARDEACWICPSCGVVWDDAERRVMNDNPKIIHRGQSIDKRGRVRGQPEPTDTLGIRYNAFNNNFWSTASIAAMEWWRLQQLDDEAAEREVRQFYWAVPYEPPEIDLAPFDPREIGRRPAGNRQGIVPAGAVAVTVGVDTGKRQCDWTAIAWMPDGTGHVIEYGEFPVDWKRLGTKAALVAALRQYANYCTWNRERGGRMPASQVWIDSGYHEHTDAVYTVCRELNNALGLKPGQERFRPSKGHGACQRMLTRYAAPKAVGSAVRYIGREYHLAQIPRARQILVHVNADHWKLQVRERFGQPADQPGALILYEGQPNEHADFLEQLAAEEPKEVYEPGKGTVIVWTTIRRKNHKLDSTYAAVAAGDYVLALQARARQRAEAGKWWAGRQRKPRRHA